MPKGHVHYGGHAALKLRLKRPRPVATACALVSLRFSAEEVPGKASSQKCWVASDALGFSCAWGQFGGVEVNGKSQARLEVP